MKALITGILFVFISIFAHASEMVGALSAGMGGTGRAAIESNETLFLNPAGLALFNKFYTGVSYLSGYTEKGVSRNTYSVTMTDGTPGLMFPGSMSYRRHSISDEGLHLTENEFKGGLGYRVTPRLSVGLAGTHLRARDWGGQEYKQTNFDAGLLFGLTPNWGLSLSGQNLLKPGGSIPRALQRRSRVALGTQFIYQSMVTMRYEMLMPLHVENSQLLGHRAGVSFGMQGGFALHGGFSVDDNLAQNWGSVGLAWRGPRLKIAYSMQDETRSELGQRHLVDLWFDI